MKPWLMWYSKNPKQPWVLREEISTNTHFTEHVHIFCEVETVNDAKIPDFGWAMFILRIYGTPRFEGNKVTFI